MAEDLAERAQRLLGDGHDLAGTRVGDVAEALDRLELLREAVLPDAIEAGVDWWEIVKRVFEQVVRERGR